MSKKDSQFQKIEDEDTEEKARGGFLEKQDESIWRNEI